MAVPKRKTSKMKARSRKASKRMQLPGLFTDSKSGNLHFGHCVDPKTGTYRGRQVISQEVEG